jgi:hypothetical protein
MPLTIAYDSNYFRLIVFVCLKFGVYLAGTLLEALMTLMVDTTQGSRCFTAHQMSGLDN